LPAWCCAALHRLPVREALSAQRHRPEPLVVRQFVTMPCPRPTPCRILCAAIGAAPSPPVASLPTSPPCSTMTATATCGSSAGANETNHACGAPLWFWAVPVLPATETPGMRAAVPVPFSTTEIISVFIVDATWGHTAVP